MAHILVYLALQGTWTRKRLGPNMGLTHTWIPLSVRPIYILAVSSGGLPLVHCPSSLLVNNRSSFGLVTRLHDLMGLCMFLFFAIS